MTHSIAATSKMPVPTIAMGGDPNGAPHPSRACYAHLFTGPYQPETLQMASAKTCPRKQRKTLLKPPQTPENVKVVMVSLHAAQRG
ncbi:hypothetical protein FGG78_40270 [Thioclava sp. BHET1]|nr:hypothetical protein FGG78_40270 [Thioclava sp. BHET1]